MILTDYIFLSENNVAACNCFSNMSYTSIDFLLEKFRRLKLGPNWIENYVWLAVDIIFMNLYIG